MRPVRFALFLLAFAACSDPQPPQPIPPVVVRATTAAPVTASPFVDACAGFTTTPGTKLTQEDCAAFGAFAQATGDAFAASRRELRSACENDCSTTTRFESCVAECVRRGHP